MKQGGSWSRGMQRVDVWVVNAVMTSAAMNDERMRQWLRQRGRRARTVGEGGRRRAGCSLLRSPAWWQLPPSPAPPCAVHRDGRGRCAAALPMSAALDGSRSSGVLEVRGGARWLFTTAGVAARSACSRATAPCASTTAWGVDAAGAVGVSVKITAATHRTTQKQSRCRTDTGRATTRLRLRIRLTTPLSVSALCVQRASTVTVNVNE